MTNAPHLLPKSREGFKYGDVDDASTTWRYDGLHRRLRPSIAMGASTEKHNDADSASPASEQDEFAARSHQRAAAAQKNGLFAEEIVPVEIPQRKGDPVVFSQDEGIRADTTAESLGKLRPAFAKDGTITAGSASQISDGAAAVVVMSKAKAEELGLTWLAEIGAHGVVAGPDDSLQAQPANAILHALRPRRASTVGRPRPGRDQRGVRRGRPCVQHASSASTAEKVNVNGGAIALGHPIGMSGARHRAAPGAGAAAPRRRRRRGRAVRRRRPGRRADRAGAPAGDRDGSRRL